MPKAKIARVKVPPLVGRKQAAEILGVGTTVLTRDVPELPPPLNDRRIKGFDVSGPIWPRREIESLARIRRNGGT